MYVTIIIIRNVLATATAISIMLGLNTSTILFGEEYSVTSEYTTGEEMTGVTLEDVAKLAENYIQGNSKTGIFKFHDKSTGNDLELTLDKVHREKLSQTKINVYFVCADFKGKDGNTYDLDFFVQGKDRKTLSVNKKSIAVHKVNGKENYTWNYNTKKDIWEKKTIKTEQEYPEPTKREHPSTYMQY